MSKKRFHHISKEEAIAYINKRREGFVEDCLSAEGFDERVDNILPIIRALDFIRAEAKRNADIALYEFISASFKLVLLVYDRLEQEKLIAAKEKSNQM